MIEAISAEATRELRQTILRPGQPLKTVIYDFDELENTFHFGIKDFLVIIAAISLYQEDHKLLGENGWRIRGMAVKPKHRNKGLGSQLLKACIDKCKEYGGRYLWCNARTTAKGVYLRNGFLTHGNEYHMEGIGPHLLMNKELM